jgi:ribonuclease-3 family protein
MMFNGQTLAYIGDAIWEIRIREYLLSKGLTKVNDLHKTAIRYTSATGEAKAIVSLLTGFLRTEEIDIFKRGRNAEATHHPKAVDLATYHQSTGFEAVIGSLYLEKKEERLTEIVAEAIRIVEQID